MDDHFTSVSLRRLAVFLTVAETLHVARAAEKLEIAQPALSQQIKALEEALGVMLFHRRKRGIDLTSAGLACRDEARRLLEGHHSLIDKVRRVARGEIGQLAIGHVGSAMAGTVFPDHLQRMRLAFPEVQIVLEEKPISELVAAVSRKDLDVALIRDLEDVPAHCEARHYLAEKLFVLLPETHPYAACTTLSMQQIRDEPMIGFQDPDDVGIAQIVRKIAAKTGSLIRPQWKASHTGSIFGMVHAGFGLAIVAESVTELMPRVLTARALDDPDAVSNLWLIWNKELCSPALQYFVQLREDIPGM